MGIFQDNIEVVVRVPRRLNVRFDGQDMNLEPNYTEEGKRIEDVRNLMPSQCIPYVLNQNIRMGTEDPHDPSSFQSLVGIVDPRVNKKNRKSWHDCSFIDETKDSNGDPIDPISVKTRVDIRQMLEDDPQVKDIKVRGLKMENGVRLPANENGGTLSPRGRG